MQETTKHKYWTIEEVADRFGVHKETIRRWTLQKVIPGAYRIHKRGRWHYNPEEIVNFINKLHTEGHPERGGARN